MDTSGAKRKEFSAGAAFRIYGIGLDIDGITRELGIRPDHRHREGELDPGKTPYAHDMWSLSSPLGTSKQLDAHLKWLAEVVLPHKEYILLLRETQKVDFYCFKSCYTEQASLVLSTEALRIFTELNLDLQVSLLCLPPETQG